LLAIASHAAEMESWNGIQTDAFARGRWHLLAQAEMRSANQFSLLSESRQQFDLRFADAVCPGP
jgi:hypothetical protein